MSTPIKVVALAGLACILALGAFLALATLHHRDAAQTVVPAVVHHETPAPRPARPKLVLSPGLPVPIHRALETSRTAVAVLYAPGIAGDHDTVVAARKGAHAAGVPFVALDVSRAAIAQRTALWLPGIGDPAVVVVTRPGHVVSTIQGWTDETSVAQAAADAR